MTSRLVDLYTAHFGSLSAEVREERDWIHERRQAALTRLKRRRIITVADLLVKLPRLPDREKDDAIDLAALLEIRQIVPVLMELAENPTCRLNCAHAMNRLGLRGKFLETFLSIADRELSSPKPDSDWLTAVVWAFGGHDDVRTEEALVAIFERRDLPGNLRGDAADKLGCSSRPHDRRTSLYRRCRETALAGLTDESIDVQFWSMYLISSLCNRRRLGRPKLDHDFKSALPQLERIAATDHRHATGVWWPMFAEAEDAITCIRTGCWPEVEAAERWPAKR